MTFLFQIIQNFDTGEYLVRKYEVVDSTPKFYYIQPRNIANKLAERGTKKIRKSKTNHLIPTMNDHFFTAKEGFTFLQRKGRILLFTKGKVYALR